MNHLEEAAREIDEHRRKQYALLAEAGLLERNSEELYLNEILRKEQLDIQKQDFEAKKITDAEIAK